MSNPEQPTPDTSEPSAARDTAMVKRRRNPLSGPIGIVVALFGLAAVLLAVSIAPYRLCVKENDPAYKRATSSEKVIWRPSKTAAAKRCGKDQIAPAFLLF